MQMDMSQELFDAKKSSKCRKRHLGPRFAWAYTVEMHMDISKEQFYGKKLGNMSQRKT